MVLSKGESELKRSVDIEITGQGFLIEGEFEPDLSRVRLCKNQEGCRRVEQWKLMYEAWLHSDSQRFFVLVTRKQASARWKLTID